MMWTLLLFAEFGFKIGNNFISVYNESSSYRTVLFNSDLYTPLNYAIVGDHSASLFQLKFEVGRTNGPKTITQICHIGPSGSYDYKYHGTHSNANKVKYRN